MTRRVLWGMIGVLLGANLYGLLAQESTGPGSEAQSMVKRFAPAGIAVVPRRYYLTSATHSGAQALTACAAGFHMASFGEILDPSNLQYDTALGHTTLDSGMGPPNTPGWVRTGHDASVGPSTTPGQANCQVWTQFPPFTRGSFNGTTVAFGGAAGWNVASGHTSPWIAGTSDCTGPTRVWCVEDY